MTYREFRSEGGLLKLPKSGHGRGHLYPTKETTNGSLLTRFVDAGGLSSSVQQGLLGSTVE